MIAAIDELLVTADVLMNEVQQEVAAIQRKARLALQSVIVSAIALALALGLIATNRMVIRPVSALKAAAGRIASGDLDCTLQIQSRDEIAELGRSVNAMAAELREMFKKLRQEHDGLEAANVRLLELDELKTKFITIASHELRTPLTIVTSLIEGLAANTSRTRPPGACPDRDPEEPGTARRPGRQHHEYRVLECGLRGLSAPAGRPGRAGDRRRRGPGAPCSRNAG